VKLVAKNSFLISIIIFIIKKNNIYSEAMKASLSPGYCERELVDWGLMNLFFELEKYL
jgi:hypothetical protein